MLDTHVRNNIYSCVSFSFTQASPPRAYLAPRVLHVPASARLRKAKKETLAFVQSNPLPPPPTLRLNGSE